MIYRILLALAVLTLATDALAFCRQRTCDPSVAACEFDEESGCFVEGGLLYYESSRLSFSIGRGTGALLGLSDADFEDIVAEAFRRWENADCAGGLRPNVRVQSAGIVDSSEGFYCTTDPGLNTSLWFLTNDWSGKDPLALAIATNTYAVTESAPNFGAIFDSDIELNVGKVERDFPQEVRREVMLFIATTKRGTFWALATPTTGRPRWRRTTTVAISLTQDDEDAVCVAFGAVDPRDVVECSPPGISEAAVDTEACEAAGRQPQESGCSLGHPGRPQSKGLWLTGAPWSLGCFQPGGVGLR